MNDPKCLCIDRSACTSVGLWEGMVVAAYGSGHIRLFSTVEPTLLCEVAAHARWITALDVASHANLVLSVSEDSFVRVWEIDSGDRVVSFIQIRFCGVFSVCKL